MENLIFATLAFIVLPIGYISLCGAMREKRVKKPPFFSFFLAFGTFGGLCVAGAVGIPLCLFCGPLILLSSMLSFFAAIRLGLQAEKNWYHSMAIGICYVTAIPFVALACAIIFGVLAGAGFHNS